MLTFQKVRNAKNIQNIDIQNIDIQYIDILVYKIVDDPTCKITVLYYQEQDQRSDENHFRNIYFRAFDFFNKSKGLKYIFRK